MSNNKDFKVKNGIQPTVYHEGLGTVVSASEGYYLAGASYDSVSFDFSSQFSYAFAFGFADGGTKMYGQRQFDGGTLYQYTLSTAYDISTASYANKSYSFANGESGFVITPDGSSLYISANDGDAVYRYTFGTAFDASTLSNGTQMFSTSSVDTQPDMCKFNSDGSKFFLLGRSNSRIYEYSVSTAYDLTTATYSNNSLLVSAQAAGPLGFDFSADGTSLVVSDNTTDSVYLYTLTTGYDLTTATYSGTNFSVSSQDSVPGGMSFINNGSKLLILGRANKVIYQYSTALATAQLDLSTGSVFDYTPTSDVQVTLRNPATSGTVSGATLLLDGGADTGYELSNASYDSVSFGVNSQAPLPTCVKFDTTGTIMYVMCLTNDAIYQYSLSTAWDVSTASYGSKVFSVASQDSSPLGLFFKPDGTKMYLSGGVSESLYQYSLATAWDVSTASYDSKSFDITGQSIDPYELFLYSSGTKLLVLMNDALYQYSLGTAYDISTASYDSVTTSFSSQDTTMTGFEFNSGGTSLIMLGLTNDKVYQYSLTTPYDITTATYDSVDFSISQDTQPHSVTFGKLGTKMFIMGLTSDTVYQYTVGTPATITYDTAIEWPGGTAPTSPAIGETDVVTFNTRDGGSTYQGVLAIDGAK